MRTFSRIFLRFLPFWLFLLFFKFAGALHYTLLAPYGQTLLPVWLAGLIIGAESLVQMVLDVPAGYLLDRFGYRRLLGLTAVLFMFSAGCLMFGLTLQTYLLTIVFSILGWLFFVPGTSAYILSHATQSESGRFFSFKDTSNAMGVVLASVSLPFVLLLSPRIAGLILAGLLLLAVLSILFAPGDKHLGPRIGQPVHQRRHIRRHSLAALFRTIRRLNPASTMLALLTFAGSMFYGIIWFVVPLVIALQVESGWLSLGLAVFDFSIVVLGYGIGTLVDKSDKRAFVFFGLLIFALCGMALGFNFGIFFILFGFLATAGEEMAGVSLWSWLHHLDHDHDADGAVSGVITFFDDMGYAAGPMLAGVLYTAVGAKFAITLGAIPIFLVWLGYYLVVHKHVSFASLTDALPRMPSRFRHKS